MKRCGFLKLLAAAPVAPYAVPKISAAQGGDIVFKEGPLFIDYPVQSTPLYLYVSPQMAKMAREVLNSEFRPYGVTP